MRASPQRHIPEARRAAPTRKPYRPAAGSPARRRGMRNLCSALAIVAVVATASGSGARAQAQSGDDHTAHHPDGAPAQAIQTPPPASSSGMPTPEMQRMQGAQGGMPGMMGDMGRMMEMMHSRMAGMAMMRPLEH